MTPEEQEFHDKWLAVFIELERETVFGIGFNPRCIEQYTPEVVTKCMATYRSRKRFRPTPLFRSLLKWTAVLGAGVCVSLAAVDQVLETSLPVAASIITQHEEFKTDMSKERNKLVIQLMAAEAKAEAKHRKAVKLQKQKEEREEAERKAAEAKKEADRKVAKAKKVANKTAKDKACSRAQSFQCDYASDNKIYGSIYLKGKRIRCIITLNKRPDIVNCKVPDPDFPRETAEHTGADVSKISVHSLNGKHAWIHYADHNPPRTPKKKYYPIHSIKAK